MPRQHDEIFARLMKPFGDFKTRPQGGRQLKYVTARQVMNRLDDVLGPDGWWDDYSPTSHGVICRLTIRLPDGQELTKVDAGGNAGMADEGDDEKSGFSDAFKRAAVKFGVGRHLYDDGIPWFADRIIREHSERQEVAAQPSERKLHVEQVVGRGNRQEAPVDQQRLGHPHAQPRDEKGASTDYGRDLYKWAKDAGKLDEINAWAKDQRPQFPFKMVTWTQEQCDAAWQQFGEVKA